MPLRYADDVAIANEGVKTMAAHTGAAMVLVASFSIHQPNF
jgi:hypothetical protein